MTEGPSSKRPDALRSVGWVLLVACLTIAMLHATHLAGAIDGAFRSIYYGVSGGSESTQRVLLVEADDDTIRAWGSPAWSAERRRDLLQRIAAGGPSAVVVLDRERMFVPAAGDGEALPSAPTVVDLELRLDPRSAVVDSLTAAELSSAMMQPVVHALGLPSLPDEALRIHYLAPVSRLPTVAFHRVALGDVPASVFRDKVVVVGLTSLAHRDPVATPVGALTPPEIFGHTLAMLADERRWYEPSWPVRAIALALLLTGSVLVLREASPARALARATGLAGAVVVIDALAFTTSVALVGVADALTVVLAALLGTWFLAQRSSAEVVKTVSDQMSERVVEREAKKAPREWFWRDMADLVRPYLGLETIGVIAELPPGGWHLQLRAFMGMTEADIVERRHDVRRTPYRAAFLTQRVARCDHPYVSDPNRHTLAVPLAHQGRMFGMWMVSLRNDMELSAGQLEAIEQLGFELGRSIFEARRAEQEARAVAQADTVTHRLSRLLSGMEALGEDKQRILDTFDLLPLGLLIADMWGHVLQLNPAIQQRLAYDLPEGIPNDELSAVLARITDQPLEGVHEMMRAAVRDGRTFQLRRRRSGGREATYLLMPMRTGRVDDSHAGGGAATRLVLIAVPDRLDELMDLSIDSTPIDVGPPPSAELAAAPPEDPSRREAVILPPLARPRPSEDYIPTAMLHDALLHHAVLHDAEFVGEAGAPTAVSSDDRSTSELEAEPTPVPEDARVEPTPAEPAATPAEPAATPATPPELAATDREPATGEATTEKPARHLLRSA